MRFHDVPGEHVFQVNLPASAAATATEDVGIFVVPYGIRLLAGTGALKLWSGSAVSGADTDSRNVNVSKVVGGVITEIAHIDLVSGTDIAVGANVLSALAANLDLAAGDMILVVSEKVGDGLATKAMTLAITAQGN